MTMWVFAYGSLLWNPGFEVAQRMHARLPGYARSFCMRSVHHRGTHEDPGLVLALDAHEGAVCEGLALAVRPEHADQTLECLRARELISSAYKESVVEVHLEDGTQVEAVTFVIDPHHEQYCADMPLEEQARIIARAAGGRGPNTEYLYNTAAHLETLGIPDAELQWLVERVRLLEA